MFPDLYQILSALCVLTHELNYSCIVWIICKFIYLNSGLRIVVMTTICFILDSIIIAVCAGVGGSVLLLVIIIVVTVVLKSKKRYYCQTFTVQHIILRCYITQIQLIRFVHPVPDRLKRKMIARNYFYKHCTVLKRNLRGRIQVEKGTTISCGALTH